jgi:hypothetical protein
MCAAFCALIRLYPPTSLHVRRAPVRAHVRTESPPTSSLAAVQDALEAYWFT